MSTVNDAVLSRVVYHDAKLRDIVLPLRKYVR